MPKSNSSFQLNLVLQWMQFEQIRCNRKLLGSRTPAATASKTRRNASPGPSGMPHDVSTFSTSSSHALNNNKHILLYQMTLTHVDNGDHVGMR